jgi:hypothetical protein
MLTYHPVFVRRPLPRDLRGFLPLPATPLMEDNIEDAKAHGLDEVHDNDPQLWDPSYRRYMSRRLEAGRGGCQSRGRHVRFFSSTRGQQNFISCELEQLTVDA